MNVFIVTGATAVGKTDLSLYLAEEYSGEIVCLDSRQIYKEINIGTAKPDIEMQKKIPHHLFNFLNLNEIYNAFKYKIDCELTLQQIIDNKKTPILVGGTGFYIDALIKGLTDLNSDDSIRNYLYNYEKNYPGKLGILMEKIDKKSFNKIHKNDLKRIIRFFEIFINSGIKFSELKFENKPKYNYKIIVLDRDRKELHERINKRVEQMFEDGLIEEVETLYKKGFNENINALNTIGYKEVFKYLRKEITYEECKELIKVNTRRYARRQIIYFRKLENTLWVNISNLEIPEIKEKVKNYIMRGDFDA